MSVNDALFGVDSSVTLTNPTKEDFTWSVNGRPYKLAAGSTRVFQGYIADLCVKHFVDKLILEDEDEKAEKMSNDLNFRKKYIDMIVISEDKAYEEEDNSGDEVEVDEGREVGEEDLTEDKPLDIDTLPDDSKLYPEPEENKKKKPSNIVED